MKIALSCNIQKEVRPLVLILQGLALEFGPFLELVIVGLKPVNEVANQLYDSDEVSLFRSGSQFVVNGLGVLPAKRKAV